MKRRQCKLGNSFTYQFPSSASQLKKKFSSHLFLVLTRDGEDGSVQQGLLIYSCQLSYKWPGIRQEVTLPVSTPLLAPPKCWLHRFGWMCDNTTCDCFASQMTPNPTPLRGFFFLRNNIYNKLNRFTYEITLWRSYVLKTRAGT